MTTEGVFPNETIRPFAAQARLLYDEVLTWYEYEQEYPTGKDPRIAAYAEAVVQEMERGTPFGREMLEIIQQRMLIVKPDLPQPPQITNQVLRGFQAIMLEHPAERRRLLNPTRYQNAKDWTAFIGRLMANPDWLGEFTVSMGLNVSSNIADRYKSIALAMRLLRPELVNGPVDLLDVGCSENHGFKKLALADKFPFQPVKAGTLRPDPSGEAEFILDEVPAHSIALNGLMQALRAGFWLGVDIYDFTAPTFRKWGESCSFYPKELLNAQLRQEFKALEGKKVPGVHFLSSDFAHLNIDRFTTYTKGQRYDAAFLCTMLYQVSPQDRASIRAEVRRHLKDDGLIIYNDFVEIGEDGDLHFPAYWPEWTYRTLVEIPSEGPQIHELFRWSNGRCREVQLGERALQAVA